MKTLFRTIRNFPPVLTGLVQGYRALHRLGLPVSRHVYQHLPYQGIVSVDCAPCQSFFIESRGNVSENSLFWEGLRGHEPESMRLWLEHAKSANCVLDIGANVGIYSLAAAAAGSTHIHAFEPLQRIKNMLLHNVALNDFENIRVWDFCISDREGTISMYDPGGDAPSSASASADFAHEHLASHQLTKIDVETITVDRFCVQQRLPKVDLVKIDVEGFEREVLAGMGQTLVESRPVILLEVLQPVGPAMRALLEDLRSLGYGIARVQEGGGCPDNNLLLIPTS